MRRSLIESISDEEREFIEAGKPQPATKPSVQEEPPAPKSEVPAVAREETPTPRKSPAPRKNPAPAAPPVLVSQTYRLPADLVKDLTIAAVARKLERSAPWSQQDIVAEALREWLQKHASKQASM